jgi:uncharacterized protein (TIGR03086 family)
MSANMRYYVASMFELDHALRRVPSDAWDEPSPCEGWSAREVAGHAIGVVANIPAKLGLGPAVNAFEDVARIAGDDPVASFRPIKWLTLTALDSEGAPATVIRSSMGEMTIDDYLVPLGRDAVVHAWDIARAVGIDAALDPDLVDETLTRIRLEEMTRGQGRYGEIVELPADASAQDRLLALTGRDPR